MNVQSKLRSSTAIPEVSMLHRPVTTAEKLRADIAQLRMDIEQLKRETSNMHAALVAQLNARFDTLDSRVDTLEDAATKPEEPPKPPKDEPPPGYVTVKTMCKEGGWSYNAVAANMLHHYATAYSAKHNHPIWRRAGKPKAYEHFVRAAADFAISRVKEELAGKISEQSPPPPVQPAVNGNGQAHLDI